MVHFHGFNREQRRAALRNVRHAHMHGGDCPRQRRDDGDAAMRRLFTHRFRCGDARWRKNRDLGVQPIGRAPGLSAIVCFENGGEQCRIGLHAVDTEFTEGRARLAHQSLVRAR